MCYQTPCLSVSWERHLVRKLTSKTTIHPNTVHQLLHKTKVLYQKSWFYMIAYFSQQKKHKLPLKHLKKKTYLTLSCLFWTLKSSPFSTHLGSLITHVVVCDFQGQKGRIWSQGRRQGLLLRMTFEGWDVARENSMFQTKFNKKLAWEMVNQNRFDEIDLSQVYI